MARAPAGPAPIGVRGPRAPPHARDPAHRAPCPQATIGSAPVKYSAPTAPVPAASEPVGVAPDLRTIPNADLGLPKQPPMPAPITSFPKPAKLPDGER